MFENVNKSKIKFEKYIDLKTKTIIKSYTERFKWIDKFLYWFSWFGNGVSIFLAFFFIQALFLSSFNGIKDAWYITVGIVIFLTMFELIKRYVLGLFSLETIKNKFNIFKGNMISFIISVIILVTGSVYLSLNGASKFVDNRQIFTEQTEINIESEKDSLNNFYFIQYIKPLMDDNKILTNQNSDYLIQSSTTNYKTKYTNLINDNNTKIENNRTLIAQYETRRDDEVSEFSNKQSDKLITSLVLNNSNITAFLIISALIELIIMIGIFYDKFYDYKIMMEYEETIVNTPEFKRWYKFNYILELIYAKTKDVGEHIPTTNNLMELSEINGAKLDKGTLDKFIKILYYLEIVKLEGNRRVLNLVEEEGIKKLRNYFNIS